MILRDRAINDNLLSFNEMNTFGKKVLGTNQPIIPALHYLDILHTNMDLVL